MVNCDENTKKITCSFVNKNDEFWVTANSMEDQQTGQVYGIRSSQGCFGQSQVKNWVKLNLYMGKRGRQKRRWHQAKSGGVKQYMK